MNSDHAPRAARCIARGSGRRPGWGCTRPEVAPGACRGGRRTASRLQTRGSTSGWPAEPKPHPGGRSRARIPSTAWCSLVSIQIKIRQPQGVSSETPGPRGGGCRRSAATLLPPSSRAASFTSADGSCETGDLAGADESPKNRSISRSTSRNPSGKSSRSGSSSITGSNSSRISRLLGGTPSATIHPRR